MDANDLANAGDWEDFQLDSQDDEMPEPDQDDTLQDLINPTEGEIWFDKIINNHHIQNWKSNNLFYRKLTLKYNNCMQNLCNR